MTVTVTPLTPHVGAEIIGMSARDLVHRRAADDCLATLQNTGWWSTARSTSTTPTSSPSAACWARSRSCRPASTSIRRSRRSRSIHPRPTRCSRATARATSTGTSTAPPRTSRRRARCSAHARSPTRAATPSSPAPTRHTTRCRTRTRRRSPTSASCTASPPRSGSPIQNPPSTSALPGIACRRESTRSSGLTATAASRCCSAPPPPRWSDGHATRGEPCSIACSNGRRSPQFVLRHHWRRGDLVMWDNTGMLHRALPFEPTSRRLLHRTTLVGEEAVA